MIPTRIWRTVSSSVRRLVAVFGIIAGVTFCEYRLFHVNAITAGFSYLIAVLLLSTFAGVREAIIASIAATLCFNFFFLPPLLTLVIADPQNWVSLIALTTTSLVATRLAHRARELTASSRQRRNELELLYSASRSILLLEPGPEMTSRAVIEIARIFRFDSFVLFDARSGQFFFAGTEEPRGGRAALEERLRECTISGMTSLASGDAEQVFAVTLGKPIGALAVRPIAISDTVLQSLANLVAISLEKTREQEAAQRSKVERENAQLKSAFLDAIAHELQTPLTSIQAAASSLLARPNGSPERVRELGSILQEEASRLGRLISEAIQMARIEGGRIRMRRGRVGVEPMIRAAIEYNRSALDDRTVTVTVESGCEFVDADAELLQLACQLLLNNAARYSPHGTVITIAVRRAPEGTQFDFRDTGPGIPEAEQERIFEKFYRGTTAAAAPGSGVGLSIVREIVHAHSGSIWVESRPGEGSLFTFVIPGNVENVTDRGGTVVAEAGV